MSRSAVLVPVDLVSQICRMVVSSSCLARLRVTELELGSNVSVRDGRKDHWSNYWTLPPHVLSPHARDMPSVGGCQLQHVAYEDQLAWKRRFVTDALTRIGGLENVSLPEVAPSPSRLRYRNRVSFTLRRLRQGHVVAGFHALHRPAHIVDIQSECLLPHESLTEAWMGLRAGWGTKAELLPLAGRLRMTLGLSGKSGDEVDLLVEGGRRGWDAEILLQSVEALSAVWHRPSGNGSEFADGGGIDLVGGRAVGALVPTFGQVNDEVAELLRAHVVERCFAAVSSDESSDLSRFQVIDAYSGSGAYGLALASRGLSVTGIESNLDAVAQARASTVAKMAEGDLAFGRFEIQEGLVEELLPVLLPADLLVLNPPRSGLHEDVPPQILAEPPNRILYVSCDSATLARDVKRLNGHYALDGLRAFDLFPQTAHVEAVAELSLRGVSG